MEDCTGQYVSISKMITALHKNTDLIKQLLSLDKMKDTDTLTNFFDGAFWRRHPLRGEQCLVIRLYGDDFEPCNPLGARKTLYKIGAIYYQFEGLPVFLQSKLENIFLALCYYTDDCKTCGWENVLKPLINELQLLAAEGLSLSTADGIICVRVVISCVTGDNLFLNGILGFVESFSARYPCRHCVVPRCKFSETFSECSSRLRTVTSYDKDAENIDVSTTGIKMPSPLNAISYFHAAENFVQDIMHDVLEGVCQYDMMLIVNHLVSLQGLSLERINGLVEHFSYGRHDISNKPVKLTEASLKCDMLPMNASQSWCFTRVLSLAVGFIVPEDDNVWLLYLTLRQILDILFASEVEIGELKLLEVLIAEYLEMHTVLFPHVTLKNKHHHLTHYPRLILEVGPLHRLWCMRFESKHLRSKKVMQMSCNFKNIPLTTASRHQYDVANRMLSNSDYRADAKLGAGTVTVLSELTAGEEISACMNNIGLHFELYSCTVAELGGISYSCGCYLLSDISDDEPQFAKLWYIFSREQGQYIWFICVRLQTLGFCEHLHAWKVRIPEERYYVSVDPRHLKYAVPLSLHYVGNESFIAGLRSRL